MEVSATMASDARAIGGQAATAASSGKTKGPSFGSFLDAISGRRTGKSGEPSEGDDGASVPQDIDGACDADEELAQLLAGTLVVLAPVPAIEGGSGCGNSPSQEDAQATAVGGVGQQQGGRLPTMLGAPVGDVADPAFAQGYAGVAEEAATAPIQTATESAGSSKATQPGAAAPVQTMGELAGRLPPSETSTAISGDATGAGVGGRADGLSLALAMSGGADTNGTGQQGSGGDGPAGGTSAAQATTQAAQLFGAVAGDGLAASGRSDQSVSEAADAARGAISVMAAVGDSEGQSRTAATNGAAQAPASDGATANGVFNQLLEQAARMSVPRNTRMRIQLVPPSLGGVDLRLTLKDGVLSLGITAELGKTREMIQAALPQLREALEQRGMEVGQFSLSAGGGNGSFSGWMGGSMGAFGAANQWGGNGRQPEEEAQVAAGSETDAANQAGRTAVDGAETSRHMVDYRI